MAAVNHIARLLTKANEVRTLASTMRDPECRHAMLAIAAEYDMLAAHMASVFDTLDGTDDSRAL